MPDSTLSQSEKISLYINYIQFHRGGALTEQDRLALSSFTFDRAEFMALLPQSKALYTTFYNKTIRLNLHTDGMWGHISGDLPVLNENGKTIQVVRNIGLDPKDSGFMGLGAVLGCQGAITPQDHRSKQYSQLMYSDIPVTEEQYMHLAQRMRHYIDNPPQYQVLGLKENNCIYWMNKVFLEIGIVDGLKNKLDYERFLQLSTRPIKIPLKYIFDEFHIEKFNLKTMANFDLEESRTEHKLIQENFEAISKRREDTTQQQLTKDIIQFEKSEIIINESEPLPSLSETAYSTTLHLDVSDIKFEEPHSSYRPRILPGRPSPSFYEGFKITGISGDHVFTHDNGIRYFGIRCTLKCGAQVSIGMPETMAPLNGAAAGGAGGFVVTLTIPIGEKVAFAALMQGAAAGLAVGAVIAGLAYLSLKLYENHQKHVFNKTNRQYESFWQNSTQSLQTLHSAIWYASQALREDKSVPQFMIDKINTLQIENIWDKKEYALKHKKYDLVSSYFMRENHIKMLQSHFEYLAQHQQWKENAQIKAESNQLSQLISQLVSNNAQFNSSQQVYENLAYLNEMNKKIKDKDYSKSLEELKLLEKLKGLILPQHIDDEPLANPRPPERKQFEYHLFGRHRSDKLEKTIELIEGVIKGHRELLRCLYSNASSQIKQEQINTYIERVNSTKNDLQRLTFDESCQDIKNCFEYYAPWFTEAVDPFINNSLPEILACLQTEQPSQALIDNKELAQIQLGYASALFEQKQTALNDPNASMEKKIQVLQEMVNTAVYLVQNPQPFEAVGNEQAIAFQNTLKTFASHMQHKPIDEYRVNRYLDGQFKGLHFEHYDIVKSIILRFLADRQYRFNHYLSRNTLFYLQAIDRLFPNLGADLLRFPEAIFKKNGLQNVEVLKRGFHGEFRKYQKAWTNIYNLKTLRIKDTGLVLNAVELGLGLTGLDKKLPKVSGVTSLSAKAIHTGNLLRKYSKYCGKNPAKFANVKGGMAQIGADVLFGSLELYWSNPDNILPAFSEYQVVGALKGFIKEWGNPGNLPTSPNYYFGKETTLSLFMMFFSPYLAIVPGFFLFYNWYTNNHVEMALQAHVENTRYFAENKQPEEALKRLGFLKEALQQNGFCLLPKTLKEEGQVVHQVKTFVYEYEISEYLRQLSECLANKPTLESTAKLKETLEACKNYYKTHKSMVSRRHAKAIEDMAHCITLKMLEHVANEKLKIAVREQIETMFLSDIGQLVDEILPQLKQVIPKETDEKKTCISFFDLPRKDREEMNDEDYGVENSKDKVLHG